MTITMKSPAQSKTSRFRAEDARWRAVLKKESGADGSFWFAVNTTGVYCRPSCPARSPKREHVTFFTSPADAENAGFRACKRCDPKGGGIAARQAQAVATACRLITASDELPALRQLAQAVSMSPGYLQRVFKRATGLTPKEYAQGHRAGRLRKALPKRSTVTEAIYDAGFNSSGRFYAGSGKMLGMNPSAYRSGGPGQTIRFAIAECSLGSILVACSAKGVCAISLGDDPAGLARNLQDQFPRAVLVSGDAAFEKCVAAVVAFVESPDRPLALPLDIRGTAFQQRVWKELQRIPAGERVSYSELAKRLGQPRSTRAVAGACAANRLAVAIPCHRVVRSDGALSGYRWGIARKKKLLARERR